MLKQKIPVWAEGYKPMLQAIWSPSVPSPTACPGAAQPPARGQTFPGAWGSTAAALGSGHTTTAGLRCLRARGLSGGRRLWGRDGIHLSNRGKSFFPYSLDNPVRRDLKQDWQGRAIWHLVLWGTWGPCGHAKRVWWRGRERPCNREITELHWI